MRMEAYRAGFMAKCAEYGISEHDASELYKKAGLEKKADPPHSGLNDDNPLAREIYRKIGYIPQSPGTMLYSDDQAEDLKRSNEIVKQWYHRPDVLGPDLENPATPEAVAADWDLKRKMGYHFGYYAMPDEKRSNGIPHIVLGGYPTNTETVFRHELGHAQDYWSARRPYDKPDQFQNDYDKDKVPFETRAWNLAGVPENNPVRRAALEAYENESNYEKRRLLPEDDPRHVDYDKSKELVNSDREKAVQAASEEYSPPHVWKDKYKDEMNRYGVHLIHDYHSALEAARRGIKFWTL